MRNLDVQELKAFVQLTDLRCAALIAAFNSATTPEDKNLLSARWERLAHQGRALRLQLEALEQRVKLSEFAGASRG